MKKDEMRCWLRVTILLRCFLCLVAVPALPAHAEPEELTIAAASDLNFAFKNLIKDFEAQTGERVRFISGSSGHFYTQIVNGAPFDLYFSADIAYPKKLIAEGLALPESLYQYAIGRIVLWVPKGSTLDVSKEMEVCVDSAVKKLAIANPKHAPYGRAAVAALEHYRIADRMTEKLVFGENIAQAAQFVQSGAADIGIIALSIAVAPTMEQLGKHWLIPADAHPPIEQGAVIVKATKHPEKAKKFLDFMKTEQARAVMKRYGFTLPVESVQP